MRMRDQDVRDIEALVHRLVANAPATWTRATWTGSGHSEGSHSRQAYHLAGGGVVTMPTRTTAAVTDHELLRKLADAARAKDGSEHFLLEVTCKPSGRYTITGTDALDPGFSSGYCVVLDRNYLPPEPGIAGPEPHNAPQVGDPVIAVHRLKEYLRRCRDLRLNTVLRPPDGDIDRVEAALGRALPKDLRALYEVGDGESTVGLFQGHQWLRLRDVVRAHTRLSDPLWPGWELGWDKVVHDAFPLKTVRRCSGHEGWIPFAQDGLGNYLAVDMSPATRGCSGQVIRIGRNHHAGPHHVADSVTTLLGHCLRWWDEARHEIDDAHVDPPWLEHQPGLRDRPRTRAVVDRPGPARLSPELQSVHVNGQHHHDLSMLQAASNLRELLLYGATTPDLRPLAGLPLESIQLVVHEVDLAPLSAHCTLRSLNLECFAPVDLAPLQTMPLLHGVDLSKAQTTGLALLTDLSQLRYLALRSDQWAALGHHRAPAELAAARLAGEPSLAEALTWASELGVDTTEAWHHAARLQT